MKGKDYKNTFSLVARFATVRSLMAFAAMKSWKLNKLDINNAFLHGSDEEVFMNSQHGYKGREEG